VLGAVSGDLVVFQNNTAGTLTIRCVLTNNTTTALTKSCLGTLLLGGTNTSTGVQTLNQAAVHAPLRARGGTASSSGASGTTTATSITKDGFGVWPLTAANTASGPIAVNNGTLLVGNNGTAGAIGPGAVTVATGAVFGTSRTDAVTLPNAIGGGGGFLKLGT